MNKEQIIDKLSEVDSLLIVLSNGLKHDAEFPTMYDLACIARAKDFLNEVELLLINNARKQSPESPHFANTM